MTSASSLLTSESVWGDHAWYDKLAVWPRELLPNGPLRFEATFVNTVLERNSLRRSVGTSRQQQQTEVIEQHVKHNLTLFFRQLRRAIGDVQRHLASVDPRNVVTMSPPFLAGFDPTKDSWKQYATGAPTHALVTSVSWWMRELKEPDRSLVMKHLNSFGAHVTTECYAAWDALDAQLLRAVHSYAALYALRDQCQTERRTSRVRDRRPYSHTEALERQYCALNAVVQQLERTLGARGTDVLAVAHERLAVLTARVLIRHGRAT